MRTTSKEAGKEALPELPDGVWFIIAGMMGQQDWAKVSGTCKAFWKTQLRVIKLGGGIYSNTPDELLWLSKRRSAAEALIIRHASLASIEALDDARNANQISATWAQLPLNLRYLSIQAPGNIDGSEDMPLPQWLIQVVSSAHKLEVLVLNLVRPVLMASTPMRALKHLAITVTASAVPANWACIESLRCLVTLHIAVGRASKEAIFSAPTSAMRLLGCSSLRALHVKNLVPAPADLEVPAGCRVTSTGLTLPKAVGNTSSGHQQGFTAILRSCAVVSIVIHTRSHLKFVDHALGQPLVKLEELEIYFRLDGDPRAAPCAFEICGAMLRLTRLHVANFGSPIHVIVSSHMRLRSLRMIGYFGLLAFTPVHAASMFRDIEHVEMSWSEDEPNHVRNMVPYLVARCTETGTEWTLQRPNTDNQEHTIDDEYSSDEEWEGSFRWLLGGGREVNRWQNTMPIDMIDSGTSMRLHNCVSTLKCDACEGCLERDGVVQKYC